jgi:hypothetical protein
MTSTRSRVCAAVSCIGTMITFGCSDVRVPDGALVSCNADDSCPDELVCEPTSRLCVRARGDELTLVDGVVEPLLLGGPALDAGVTVRATITLSAAPLRLPVVRLEQDGVPVDAAAGVVEVTATADPTVFAATLTAGRGLPEGRIVVAVEAVDAVGLPRRFIVGAFEVDVTPPLLSGAGLVRVPDPRATPVAFDILDDDAVGPATAVRLSVSTSEPVVQDGDDAPRLSFEGVELPWVHDDALPNPVTFDLVWPDAPPAVEGRFAVRARVVDRAGNITDEVILSEDVGVLVDTVPPAAPAVDVQDAVVFERAPWGRSEQSGVDVYTVTGTAAVEGGGIVLVSRDAEGRREIGRVVADLDGTFGGLAALQLETGDLATIFVAVADRAGNVSPRVAVRDTLWIASPGARVVGDDVSNPHAFEEVPLFDDRLGQGGVAERGSADGLDGVDGVTLSTSGAGTFSRVATDNGSPLVSNAGVIIDTAVGHDPMRGETLFFGGADTGRQEFGTGSLSDRDFCTGAVDDVFVRGLDGRIRRLNPSLRPPGMRGAAIAWDPRLEALVLVGQSAQGAPQMWRYAAGVFAPLCTEATCAATMPAGLSGHALVYDANSRTLLAHGGGLAGTFAFDGARWAQVCGGDVVGCTPVTGGTGSLMWDHIARRVLWWNGTALSAWDGTTWTSLCTDAACASTAPPAMQGVQAAWDRRRGRLVAFAGERVDIGEGLRCDGGIQNAIIRFGAEIPNPIVPPTAETWEFDGERWEQRTPTTSPPARLLHRMAYDDRRGQVIVVGGDDCDCHDRPVSPGFLANYSEDAWAWDGLTWNRLDGAPPVPAGFQPVASFSARDHRITSWPEQGGALIYGDASGARLHLIKDGRFFRSTTNADNVGLYQPGFGTAPDGTVVVLGGGGADSSGGGPSGGLGRLVVSGTTTAFICPEFAPCVQGPAPFGHAFTHDGVRAVAFGGSFGGGGSFGFTLSNLATATMIVVDDAGIRDPCAGGACGELPPGRMGGLLAPTGVEGESLLYGGAPFDDRAWVFDGTTWTAVPTTTVPRVRQGHALAFEPARGAVMMTLGTNDNSTNDTRGGVTERILPADLDDVYEWAADDWHLARVSDPEGDDRPRARHGVAAGPDVDGSVLIHGGTPSPNLLFGGPSPSTPRLNELWRWDGGAQRHPAHRFRARTLGTGFDVEEIVGAEVRWTSAGTALPVLLVWDGSAWLELETRDCGAGCVAADLDGALARSVLFGARRELIVAARGPENGPAPAYATVVTDFVDVRLRARRGG